MVIECAVAVRVESVRPMRAMWETPARAKECAVVAPMPVPPPVMRTVLFLREREGCVGLMEGKVVVCQVFVSEGKGSDILRSVKMVRFELILGNFSLFKTLRAW